MWNPSEMIGRMRSQLCAALPDRAFLKRDRGNALFVTNAPALGFTGDAIPGFVLLPAATPLRILPDAGWLHEAENACPEAPDDLCRSLLRFRSAAIPEESLYLFAQGIKLLDEGASVPAAEIAAYDKALRQSAARALRCGEGGGLYACALLKHELNKLK